MSETIRAWRGGSLALAAVLALGACGTEPVEIDEQMLEDVALLAADETLEDVTLWGAALSFSSGPAATEAPQATAGRPGGHHGWSGTFSGTRSVTFYDENGSEMPEYDPLLTEAINIFHEIEGEVSRAGWSASVFRSRDKTVSGLLGEETTRTWNGTGESQISRSQHLDDGSERSYEAVGSVEYEDVVVPIPGSDPRWPLSGTIRRSFTVTRTGPDGSMTRTVEVVITFNGTSTVEMVVNGVVMELDLAATDGANPVRHRRG